MDLLLKMGADVLCADHEGRYVWKFSWPGQWTAANLLNFNINIHVFMYFMILDLFLLKINNNIRLINNKLHHWKIKIHPSKLIKHSIYRVPLHYASAHTHGDCVASLINAGRAAVNITDRRGCTPLHYASAWDHDAKWDCKIYFYCVLNTSLLIDLKFQIIEFFNSFIDYVNRLSKDLKILITSYWSFMYLYYWL